MRQTTRLTAPIVGAAPDIGGLMASIATACLRRTATIALACAVLCVLGSCGHDERLVEIQHEHTLDEADFARVNQYRVRLARLGVSPLADGRILLHIHKLSYRSDQDIDLVAIDPVDGSWTAFTLPFIRNPNPDWAEQLVSDSIMFQPTQSLFITRTDLDERVVRVVSPVLSGETSPVWFDPRISPDGRRAIATKLAGGNTPPLVEPWVLHDDPADASPVEIDLFDHGSLRWTHDGSGYFVQRHQQRDPRTADQTDAFGVPLRMPTTRRTETYIDRHDLDSDRVVRVVRTIEGFRIGEPSPCGRYIAGSRQSNAYDGGARLIGIAEIATGQLRWIDVPWGPHPDGVPRAGNRVRFPLYAWRADGERFLAMVIMSYLSGRDTEFFVGEFDPESEEMVRSWEITPDHGRPMFHPDGTIIIPRKGVGLETLNDDGSISVLWRLDSLFGGP